VADHVSHPYYAAGKIIILYILILNFLREDGKTKDSELNGGK
jgi:hypothetical protein